MPQIRKKTHGKRVQKKYTMGEINAIIDAICHPLYTENQAYRLLDGAMHVMAEKNLSLSIRKFVQYNLPAIIEMTTKRRKPKEKVK